jgi:hypothetical protein
MERIEIVVCLPSSRQESQQLQNKFFRLPTKALLWFGEINLTAKPPGKPRHPPGFLLS